MTFFRSYFKIFFLDLCSSVKMRMQLLKIVLVLLVAGSGDTRPQNGWYSGNHMFRDAIGNN